jgi:hypothetical protein
MKKNEQVLKVSNHYTSVLSISKKNILFQINIRANIHHEKNNETSTKSINMYIISKKNMFQINIRANIHHEK